LNTLGVQDLGIRQMKIAKNFHQNGIIALRWLLRWKKFVAHPLSFASYHSCNATSLQSQVLGLINGRGVHVLIVSGSQDS
jgi:hypothetical protein